MQVSRSNLYQSLCLLIDSRSWYDSIFFRYAGHFSCCTIRLEGLCQCQAFVCPSPPGIDADDFMSVSRAETIARIEESYENGRKRAPVTHVSKNADTYVQPASAKAKDSAEEETTEQGQDQIKRERQSTSRQVKSTAASAPARSGREKAAALDSVYFNEGGAQPRLVIKGLNQPGDVQEGGQGFSRATKYPHQRLLGPDGMPMLGAGGRDLGGANGKKHFKRKEGKKRSGKGYD